MVDYVNQFTNLRAIWRMAGTLDQVRWLVANGFAVIIESGYEPRGEGWFGHYEIVVGYDTTRNTITIYDSYLGRSSQPQTIYSETQFDQQWQSFNRNYIVIYPPNREAELQNFLGADWYERTNRVKAVQVAQAEATQQGDNPFVWFNLGTSLTAIGRYEEAVAAYERAFELGLPYRMLWYQFNPYEAYIQTGRFDDLFTLANNTLKTTQYVEETFYYKGRAYELQGDYTSAAIEYQNAVSFNPNHSQAVIALNRVKSYQ
jgi:tetratricopeptide (TPR) repeat protein